MDKPRAYKNCNSTESRVEYKFEKPRGYKNCNVSECVHVVNSGPPIYRSDECDNLTDISDRQIG